MTYRYKDASGQTIYSDRPPAASEASSSVEVFRGGKFVSLAPAQEQNAHAEAKGHINDARKHIPKALVYVDYIEYLIKIISKFSGVGDSHDTLVPRAPGQAI